MRRERSFFSLQNLSSRSLYDIDSQFGLRSLINTPFSLCLLRGSFLFLLLLVLLLLLSLVLFQDISQVLDVLISLRQKESQSLVLLLINKFPVTVFIFCHQSPHSFLLNPFLLLLLFSLCVGMISGYCFVNLSNLCLDVSMVFLEILCMLKDCIQVFLVFLSSLLLLFHLLLLLQFFCDPCISQSLSFRSLVKTRVDSCFQRSIFSHSSHNFLSQLLLKLSQTQSS